MFPLFQKYLNTQVRTNKLVNSVVYHLCPSILASVIHPYFFKLLRVLPPSRMLVQFSLTCIFYHAWENQFMVFTLENELNLRIFNHAPVPHSKLQVHNFLKVRFTKGPRTWKLWFALLKFNQKIWRWHGTLVYLYFVWFIIFINVMALLFCE